MNALVALPIAVLLTVATGCEPSGDADTAEGEWWETDVVAESPWSVSYGVGARGHVGVGAGGSFAVGDPDGRVFIAASPDDVDIYEYDVSNPSTTPVLVDGVVVVRGTDGTLLALNADDGEVLWESVDHMPIESNGVLVLARNTLDPALRARDPLTGEVLWTVEDDEQVHTPLHAADGKVCGDLGAFDFSVVDTSDGTELYRVAPGLVDMGVPGSQACTVLDDGGLLVLGAVDSSGPATELVRYDNTGAEVARVRPFDGDWALQHAVVRDDGHIIAWGATQATALLDNDLQVIEQWTDRTPRAVDPVSGNMLYGFTLVDSDWNPIWRADVGTPTHAYRFVGATVVGETAYITDTQEGVLDSDRWTRSMMFEAP